MHYKFSYFFKELYYILIIKFSSYLIIYELFFETFRKKLINTNSRKRS